MPFDLSVRLAAMSPETKIKAPIIPVKVRLYEGKLVFEIVSKKRAELANLADYDIEAFDALPLVAEALEAQERAWEVMRGTKAFTPTRRAAEDFRSYFLATARFLFRKDETVLAELDRIAQGSGKEDLVADLNDIAALAEKPEYAAKLALDKKLPQDVPAHARELASNLVKGKDNTESLEARARRNQLYWLLTEIVAEARAGGRFLFRDDPQALTMLASNYDADRKRRARQKKSEPAAI
jgi:hypothetical protein